MFPFVAVVLAVAVAAPLVLAARRPNTFRLERSITIKAPPEKIFPHIADFQRWAAWSPFEKLDPAMTKTHTGATSGLGAVYAWEGNQKAGAGRMEIVEATPPTHLTIKLDFSRPFTAHNTAEFTLTPNSDGTDVTWAMHGPSPFARKVTEVFINLDNLVGKDFALGLQNLKAIAEA